MHDERRADHLDAHHADQAGGAGADHLLVDDGLAHDVGTLAAVLGGPGELQVPGVEHLALPGLGVGEAAGIAKLQWAFVALATGDVARQPGANFALERALCG